MSSIIVTITAQGDANWIDKENIYIYNDGLFSTYGIYSAPGQTSDLYAVINPNQLPVGSIITGIQVKINKRDRDGVYCRDVYVDLLNNWIPISENKKNLTDWPADASWRLDTYGDSTDMWTTSLTSTEINSGNIALRFNAEKYDGHLGVFIDVDYIGIEIFYSGSTPSGENVYGPQVQSV